MKIYLILLVIAYVRGATIPEKECNGVQINEQCYEKNVLRDNLDRPYLLSIDRDDNILYFSHSVDNSSDAFEAASIDLDSEEFAKIAVPNGFAQTVDELTHDVYIGGEDGIYKFDAKDKSTILCTAKGENIWRIHFNKVLYYVNFPSQFLFIVEDGNAKRYKDLEDTKVDFFLFDNNNTIFYVNETGFYEQAVGSKDAFKYDEIQAVRELTLDVNGKPYVCTIDGIFEIDRENRGFNKILELDDGFGLAFDKQNNIIYADSESVVRLVPIGKNWHPNN